MNILLDCDGVLADFIGTALDRINELVGPEVVYGRAAVTGRDMIMALGLEERRKDIEIIFQEVGFARAPRPIPFSYSGVKSLIASGHNIHIVTSPMPNSPTWASDRDHWIETTYDISCEKVMHVRAASKRLVRGDIFVDDDPSTVRAWQDSNPEGLAILFLQPHNENERKGLVSVRNWSSLVSLLDDISVFEREVVAA